ncbi:MAG: amidase family protein [Polyangiales bacterium]
MTIDLSKLDATAQAELVARGEVTSLELVEAAIARIEALEPRLHALASTAFEAARRRAAETPRGVFGGVPFLAKDLLAYPGLPHRMGSRLFAANVATQGSPFTERLDAAGLVMLGKTTTSEFGLLGSTETRAAGITRNPWDPERSATGSSGGSAAAVASGMVPMAHASDGGGSIRIPASACGVFGLKPSRGRNASVGVPDMNGLVIEHCVSRTVRDSASLLAVLEEPAGGLSRLGLVSGPSTRRLRIGADTRTLMGEEPVPEARTILEKSVALCRALGHEVVEIAAPPVDGRAISDGFFTLAGAGMSLMAEQMSAMLGRPVGEGELEPFTLALIAWSRSLQADAIERAMGGLFSAADAMSRFLAAYDVVLTPTTPCETPRLGHLSPELDRETLLRRTETLAGYTAIHNIAGVPAMSVPLFRTSEGLPLGSHFAASLGREDVLLSLAYELEAAAPWVDSYPTLPR